MHNFKIREFINPERTSDYCKPTINNEIDR